MPSRTRLILGCFNSESFSSPLKATFGSPYTSYRSDLPVATPPPKLAKNRKLNGSVF